MAAFHNRLYAQTAHTAAEPRADRSPQAYWRVRMQGTLERLEREARRMFQLEEELHQFANHYYEAVGGVTERLAQVEQRLAADVATEKKPADTVNEAMPVVLAQRDAGAERRVELKARYRSLAKEIHPDRAMVVGSAGNRANHMHALNTAYQHGDLAALLRLEAEMVLTPLLEQAGADTAALERGLREVERAADTYADGYRGMLGSPLNELMLRAMSARLAGWDWVDAVVKKVERTIVEKERAAVEANIAAISEWRTQVGAV